MAYAPLFPDLLGEAVVTMGEVERTEDGVLTKFLTVFGAASSERAECMGCILGY